MYTIEERDKLKPLFPKLNQLSRRQDLPKAYLINGAVYIADCQWLIMNKSFINNKTIAYQMDSINSLDIDSEIDFQTCEYLLANRNK